METINLLYEGKAKKVYSVQDEKHVLVEFKDDATAFNGVKKAKFKNKGITNNKLSSHIFQILEKNNIKTHFLEQLSDRTQLVKKVEIIPLEVVARNVVAGSLLKRTGLPEGATVDPVIVEFYYKRDDLGDPLLNESHIDLLNIISPDRLRELEFEARKINDILCEFFKSKSLRLVDFKLEFGYDYNGDIILADEISPDTCRLWDSETNQKFDKDVFRFGLGDLTESYAAISERLGV